jgi:hypothetical protein
LDYSVGADQPLDVVKVAGRAKMGDGPASHTGWIVGVVESCVRRDCDDFADTPAAMEPPDMPDAAPLPGGYRAEIRSRERDRFLEYCLDGRGTRKCNVCKCGSIWADETTEARGDRGAYVEKLDDIRERLMIGDFTTGRL